MKPSRPRAGLLPRTPGLRASLLGYGLLLMLSGLPAAGVEDLRAGFARVDITPTQPVRMAGYESRKDPSKGVHDPLGARAAAFAHGGFRLVLVSLDNLGFYSRTAEPLRKSVLDACELKPAELFLCAIHTHSAPTLTLDVASGLPANVEYTKALGEKLVEVVRKALNGLEPVEVALGTGSSPVGVNRREVVEDSSGKSRIVLGRNPNVVTDKEVQVLRCTRPGQEKLVAILFAYATHSTSLGPRNYLVSGDIHGLAEQFLEKYYGPDLVAPGFAGASGDVDPWVRVLPGFRSESGWIPEPVLMGTMLGEEVARVAERISDPLTNCVIRSAMKTVSLPAKPSTEFAELPKPAAPFSISVARLGDIAFVGWGGEVFNEVGRAVKAGSPFRETFIITHCNGAAGYVPTRPSYSEGGYEVQSSQFARGAAEQLAKETLSLLRELHANAE